MATPDAHLVAIDSRNGQHLWNTEMHPCDKQAMARRMAPIAVKESGRRRIRRRISGNEDLSMRTMPRQVSARGGFGDSSEGEPGGETWAADSWKRGGGPTWMTGTYDPELNTAVLGRW